MVHAPNSYWKNRLFNFEILKHPQQALSSPHCDLIIERTWRTAKIVIGSQMDHGDDAIAMQFTDGFQPAAQAFVGS